MRGPLLVASLVLVAASSGCFGADVHVEPQRSSDSSPSAPPAPPNDLPVASFVVLNQSGVPGLRHYVGENVTLDASASHDPDGQVVNYTWRQIRLGGFDAAFGDRYGPKLTYTLMEPGDRTIVLQVRDDDGALMSDYLSIAVNQHRVESGTLLAGQIPIGAGPVGARNYSLQVVEGVLALSINANFTKDQLTKVKLEIRSPNGTVLNKSEAIEGPLWAIAAPQPGVLGNYTAHIGLVTGVATDFRLEFIAWYGYS